MLWLRNTFLDPIFNALKPYLQVNTQLDVLKNVVI
jgi:hypothetical protein